MGPKDDRSEIVFFDVETTVPTRPGQRFSILEFGAILVCPRKLTELLSYAKLVRPADLSLISSLSERCNGITREAVGSAPTFAEIADEVYDLLHGRIWAGHNILRFDCVRIRDAFAEINRPAPEPKGAIDSLVLLTQKFGRRAGDMKMATLATYFGLGRQSHRSLDDVRMNLEVLKYCATVLLLESSLPDVFTENCWVSPNAITRSRSNGKFSPDEKLSRMSNPSSSLLYASNSSREETHPILSLTTCSSKAAMPNFTDTNSFDMVSLSNEMERESLQSAAAMDEKNMQALPGMSSSTAMSEGCGSSTHVLGPDDIRITSISASLVPFYHGSQRIELLHNGFTFQLYCTGLKVRFGLSTKFVDHGGRPRLSFVVDASQSLCKVLDACDGIAQKLYSDSDNRSDWKPVVTRKEGFFNYPTVRLHIPTEVSDNIAKYATEMYQRESSGTVQRLLFSKFDAAELEPLFTPGILVDALFSLDTYDYQQIAGIRLVAKKMIINDQPQHALLN
ncbi:hypothetical protein L6164_011199 [Bauhinia variegata]|uniref:Uncharacterized protein n=1 Tax=Bauhinia variegata TaxID=167791 RepID=A0ACB9P524_BAUVA|nr:hypothetical protein L6164_011199 [Bauhinia variegata]